MTPHDVVMGLISGCVALAFGLIPGLFDDLVRGVYAFSVLLGIPAPGPPLEAGRIHKPSAILGAVIVAFTLLAYLWN